MMNNFNKIKFFNNFQMRINQKINPFLKKKNHKLIFINKPLLSSKYNKKK